MIYAWAVVREGTTLPSDRGDDNYVKVYATQEEAVKRAKQLARSDGDNWGVYKVLQTHLVKPPACDITEVA